MLWVFLPKKICLTIDKVRFTKRDPIFPHSLFIVLLVLPVYLMRCTEHLWIYYFHYFFLCCLSVWFVFILVFFFHFTHFLFFFFFFFFSVCLFVLFWFYFRFLFRNSFLKKYFALSI